MNGSCTFTIHEVFAIKSYSKRIASVLFKECNTSKLRGYLARIMLLNHRQSAASLLSPL